MSEEKPKEATEAPPAGEENPAPATDDAQPPAEAPPATEAPAEAAPAEEAKAAEEAPAEEA